MTETTSRNLAAEARTLIDGMFPDRDPAAWLATDDVWKLLNAADPEVRAWMLDTFRGGHCFLLDHEERLERMQDYLNEAATRAEKFKQERDQARAQLRATLRGEA